MADLQNSNEKMEDQDEEKRKKREREPNLSDISLQSPPTKELRSDTPKLEELIEAVVESKTRILAEQIRLFELTAAETERKFSNLERQNQLLRDSLSEAEDKVRYLEAQNQFLWEKTDELEQYSRGTSIRIFGIPETVGLKADEEEDTDSLVIQKLQTELDLDVTGRIGISHRIGRKSSDPRPIICQFVGKNTKKKTISAIKQQTKVCRESGRPRPSINVVEDLTPRRSALAYAARQAHRDKKILGTWTDNGRIKVRLNNEARDIVVMKTEEDLWKYTIREKSPANATDNRGLDTDSVYHHQPLSSDETRLPDARSGGNHELHASPKLQRPKQQNAPATLPTMNQSTVVNIMPVGQSQPGPQRQVPKQSPWQPRPPSMGQDRNQAFGNGPRWQGPKPLTTSTPMRQLGPAQQQQQAQTIKQPLLGHYYQQNSQIDNKYGQPNMVYAQQHYTQQASMYGAYREPQNQQGQGHFLNQGQGRSHGLQVQFQTSNDQQ